jgi:hypothetical protein
VALSQLVRPPGGTGDKGFHCRQMKTRPPGLRADRPVGDRSGRLARRNGRPLTGPRFRDPKQGWSQANRFERQFQGVLSSDPDRSRRESSVGSTGEHESGRYLIRRMGSARTTTLGHGAPVTGRHIGRPDVSRLVPKRELPLGHGRGRQTRPVRRFRVAGGDARIATSRPPMPTLGRTTPRTSGNATTTRGTLWPAP